MGAVRVTWAFEKEILLEFFLDVSAQQRASSCSSFPKLKKAENLQLYIILCDFMQETMLNNNRNT